MEETLSDSQFWRQRGLCTECHAQDAFTMAGRALCGECARKSREAKARKYEFQSPAIRFRNREAYQMRKENRLCVKCSKPLEPGNNRVRCLSCTRKLSRHDKQKVFEKPLRGDNGICWMCNKNPIEPGRECCAECYPKMRDNMLKAQRESTRRRKKGAKGKSVK